MILQRILSVVARPPVPLIAGSLLLVLVTWFGGELLRSSIGWPQRGLVLALCVGEVVAAAAFVVLRRLRARRKALSIEQEIRKQARAEAAASPLPDRQSDIEELQKRFDEALEALKGSKLGRGALYALPWYVIIGPPGSGKTTAITESGLNFPALKGPAQKRGIRGLGGTRNCDWWFTDQAILLDTAGRYTTEVEDHEEWLAFLGMIKRARSQKPINGVMVAISVDDVLKVTDDGLTQHAETIRRRIDELVEKLEVVFPVYLVLTKCDLLDGFVETFSALTKEGRNQVWGATFDAAGGGPGLAETFAAEFDQLCQRLELERMRLLVPDRPLQAQRKIFSLPLQLRAARKRLCEFVDLLTKPNPYGEAGPLRGFYLTSGTQEGAPIDRVLQRLTEAYRLDTGGDDAPLPTVDAKSYFVRDLFTRVMVTDKDLARSSASVQRRRELWRKGILIGSVAGLLIAGTTSVMTWSDTSGRLAAVGTAVAAVREHPMDSGRSGSPAAEARTALLALREAYLQLAQAYTVASVLGPSYSTVEKGLELYADALKPAFLLPLEARLRAELDRYAETPVAPGDALERTQRQTRIDQLLEVYRALRGDGYVDPSKLRDAIDRWNLWKWDPGALLTAGSSRPDDDDRKHLDTWLETLTANRRLWSVDTENGLIEKTREALKNEDFVGSKIDEILAVNPGLLDTGKEDLVDQVTKQVNDQLPSSKDLPSEQLRRNILEKRQQMVLQQLAEVGPGAAAGLRQISDYLFDLETDKDSPMAVLRRSLQVLRSSDSLEVDPAAIEGPYQQSLGAMKEMRHELDALEGHLGGGISRTDALPFQALQAADAKLNTTQRTVDTQLKQIANVLPPLVLEPVRASLQNLMDAMADGIARSFAGAVQDMWQSGLGAQLAAAGREFPFDAKAAGDYDSSRFQQLFRPAQGDIDTTLLALQPPVQLTYLRSRLAFSDRFVALQNRIRSIQSALFAAGGDGRPRIVYRVTRMAKAPNALEFKLVPAKGQVIDMNAEIDDASRANQTFDWQVGTVGAQLTVQLAESLSNGSPAEILLAAPAQSGWGFLRLLTQAEQTSSDQNSATSYHFALEREDPNRRGNPFRSWAELSLRPDGAVSPFADRFFELPADVPIYKVLTR